MEHARKQDTWMRKSRKTEESNWPKLYISESYSIFEEIKEGNQTIARKSWSEQMSCPSLLLRQSDFPGLSSFNMWQERIGII